MLTPTVSSPGIYVLVQYRKSKELDKIRTSAQGSRLCESSVQFLCDIWSSGSLFWFQTVCQYSTCAAKAKVDLTGASPRRDLLQDVLVIRHTTVLLSSYNGVKALERFRQSAQKHEP